MYFIPLLYIIIIQYFSSSALYSYIHLFIYLSVYPLILIYPGLDAELARKQNEKYDPIAEQTVRQWLEAVTGEAFGEGSFASQLRSGERLCRLANALRAGSVAKINASSLPFKQMENISHFLKAIRALGVAEHDLFEVSTYETIL